MGSRPFQTQSQIAAADHESLPQDTAHLSVTVTSEARRVREA
jgi:hypothetical protein